ncbi:MAG: 16S rRNA (cytosine(1402)-N(4))-methyltransferase RsmH [Candidatus Omnitrophica bacterium]|nr:16S rRNA (cytosine(1402)-N(4))-methyltransferase RsmH [Candidatus Omnitrophota bacterium]
MEGIRYHIPVMSEETIEYLNLKRGMTVVDATIGTGGHALHILKKILPTGLLIGIDKDSESLEVAKERLREFGDNIKFIHGDFKDIDLLLKRIDIYKVDGIFFDLGLSMYQLSNPERGFSFQSNGPLDMRIDRQSFISAYDLVNNLNEEEISNLLWRFGQEKRHNRIARLLVKERQKKPIQTTQELARLIAQLGGGFHYRIHPATRTFQALRIAVNRELEVLKDGLNKVLDLLNPEARIVIICFHSLEDRIVKQFFRKFAAEERVKIITKKPLCPSYEEIVKNPSARSAKMRVAEKL